MRKGGTNTNVKEVAKKGKIRIPIYLDKKQGASSSIEEGGSLGFLLVLAKFKGQVSKVFTFFLFLSFVVDLKKKI